MYDVCKGASRITGRVEESEQGEKIIARILLRSLVVGIFRGQNLGVRLFLSEVDLPCLVILLGENLVAMTRKPHFSLYFNSYVFQSGRNSNCFAKVKHA
jgi:hypothetical protein